MFTTIAVLSQAELQPQICQFYNPLLGNRTPHAPDSNRLLLAGQPMPFNKRKTLGQSTAHLLLRNFALLLDFKVNQLPHINFFNVELKHLLISKDKSTLFTDFISAPFSAVFCSRHSRNVCRTRTYSYKIVRKNLLIINQSYPGRTTRRFDYLTTHKTLR